MNRNDQMIEKLKKEAIISPPVNAVMHLLALRKRSRSRLTLGGLRQKMAAEGFKYSTQEYTQVLKILADSGLGTLQTSHKGKVQGLTDIKVTLQSVGKAVCGDGKTEIRPRKEKTRFTPVKSPIRLMPKPQTPTMAVSAVLTLMVNGKAVNVRLPENFTGEDFQALLDRLHGVDSHKMLESEVNT